MYNALNEDFMFQEMADRAASMRGVRTNRERRRWWRKAALRAG